MAINLYQDGMGTGPTAQYWTAPTSPWTSGASYAGGSVARYTGNGWVSDSNVAENKDVSLLNGESGVVGVQAFFQDISGVPFKDLGLAVEWFSKNSSLRCDWIRIFILSADASTVKEVIWSYNVNAATTTMPSFFNSATYGVPSVTDYDMINDRVGIEITFTNTGTITHAATMTGIDLQWQNGNWRGYSDATGYAVLAANKAPIWIKSGGVDNFRTTTNVKTDTQYYLRIGDTAGTTHDTWGFLNGNSFYLAYASVNSAGYLGVGYGATTYKVWARPEEDSNFYRDAFSITFITQHYDANVLLYNNGTGYIFSYHRYSTATHRMKTYKTTDYGVTWALHLTANLVYTTGIAAYAGMQVSEANNGYHCWIYRDSASNGRALIMNGTTAYYVVFDGGGSTTTQVVGTIPTTNSSNSVFAIWIDSSSNLKATSIDLSTQTVGSTSTIDTSVTGWITPTYDDHNEKGFVCYHKSDNVIKTAMYDGTWNISSITTSYQDGALLHDPVNNDVYLMYQDTQYQSQFGCVVKWNNTTDAWDPHVRRCRTGNLPGQNELYMKIQNGFMNLDGFDPRYNDMEPYDETGMWDFHDWNLDYIWPDNGNTSRTWRAIGESPDGSWAVFFCTQTNTQGVAHTLKSAKSLLGGKEKNQIFGLGANWLTRQKSTGEGIFASYQENNFSLGRKNENKIGKHEMEFPVYFPSSNLSNGDTIDLRLTRGTNSGTSTYLVNYPQLTIGTAEFPYTYVDGQSDDLTVAETYDTLLVTALFEGITISLASLSASSSSISVADGCSVNEVVGYGFFDFLADTFNALDSNYITYFMDADDGWTVDDSTQLSTTVFLLDLLTASLSVDTKHVVQCLEDLKAVGAFSSKMTQ
ncbi:MAG: hypothetical protein KJO69_08180, partial [Gammaproteobacteria bacterium]|nr:hypothetical protein [Gammaproteobacteria bacterium]